MTTRQFDPTLEAEAAVRELLADAALASLLAWDGPPGFLVESVDAEPREDVLGANRGHVVIVATIILPTARDQSPASELLGWLHTWVGDRAAATQGVTLAGWAVDNAGDEERGLRRRAIAVFTA